MTSLQKPRIVVTLQYCIYLKIPLVFKLYTQLTSCRYYTIGLHHAGKTINKDKTAAANSIVNLVTDMRDTDKTDIFRLYQKRMMETFVISKMFWFFICCSLGTDKTYYIIFTKYTICRMSRQHLFNPNRHMLPKTVNKTLTL